MNAKTQLFTVLVLAALGAGCERDPSEAAVNTTAATATTASPVRSADGSTAAGPAGADADVNTSGRPAEDAADDAPAMIDFAMLGEARSQNLIDMTELRFPEALQALDGGQVSMIGFMAPYDNLNDMRNCMILPNYVGCNFCAPPRNNQVVFVTQGDDDESSRTYPFIESASKVVGTLRLTPPSSESSDPTSRFVYTIENAVITPHEGEAPERAANHGTEPHEPHETELEPVTAADLVVEVAELIGYEPIRPIEFERVSAEAFGTIVRSEVEGAFAESTRQARVRAFLLLGVLPGDIEGAGWVDALTEHELTLRVAVSNAAGDRISLLDYISFQDPFGRLELVGEIAEALIRQHFPERFARVQSSNPAAGTIASDDARRAWEALDRGFRTVTIHRYARARDISSNARMPAKFVHETRVRRRGQIALRLTLEATEFGLWLALPSAVGPFLVDSILGETKPLAEIAPVLENPPSTTMEFFRPRWYEDAGRWRQDPVAPEFADALMDTPPTLTDSLGIGGLVPMLAQWYAVDVAKVFAGRWAGDRWAYWDVPGGGSALLLETRWQDEAAAADFLGAIPDHPLWRVLPLRDGSTRVRLLRADSMETLDRLVEAVRQDS